jgi:NitT/TauT family transport system ATP-binding protein
MTALRDFDLEVAEGEFLCLVGPSGCGKSTFLRILAGLDHATGGEVRISPAPTRAAARQRGVPGVRRVPVEDGAAQRRVRARDARRGRAPRRETEARRWIDKVALTRFADYYPAQLSGGMKQRVSIARALANDPQVLLMDEPLGALDAQTRAVLQEELLQLWEEARKTVLYVTHSIDEAVFLADRIVVMTAHPGTVKTVIDVDLPRPARPRRARDAGVRRAQRGRLGGAARRGAARDGGAGVSAWAWPLGVLVAVGVARRRGRLDLGLWGGLVGGAGVGSCAWCCWRRRSSRACRCAGAALPARPGARLPALAAADVGVAGGQRRPQRALVPAAEPDRRRALGADGHVRPLQPEQPARAALAGPRGLRRERLGRRAGRWSARATCGRRCRACSAAS